MLRGAGETTYGPFHSDHGASTIPAATTLPGERRIAKFDNFVFGHPTPVPSGAIAGCEGDETELQAGGNSDFPHWAALRAKESALNATL